MTPNIRRRDFCKTAVVAAAASHLQADDGPPAHLLKPFSSLEEALDGPCSTFFGVKVESVSTAAGVRRQRLPRDSKTRYPAGGVSGEEEPHSFFLSFEITNNSIVCSATSTGLLQSPCIFSRMVSAERRGRKFEAAELLGGSAWSFGIRLRGEQPVRLPMTQGTTVQLLGNVFPLFGYSHGDLCIRVLTFAPSQGDARGGDPRAILAVLEIRNTGPEIIQASVLAPNLRDEAEVSETTGLASPVESPHPRFTEHPVPIKPGFEAVVCLDETSWNPGCPAIACTLKPGEVRILSFGLLLGRTPEELRSTARVLRSRSMLDWLNMMYGVSLTRYGRLSIADDPYYSENYVRLVEEGSTAILYSPEGAQFNGGPSGFSDFGMTLFEPEFVAPTLRSLDGFRPRPVGSPAPAGLDDSLVNALGPLYLVAPYYRTTGDRALFKEHPGLLVFARERLADILATRQGEPYLFPSKMIWDGPSLGDYHTGSNIMAWLAFDGMARVAAEIYNEPVLAALWSDTAARIRKDIYRYCTGNSSLGRRFFEGGNRDGTFAPGHDGEEAFTTLAPFFGFCEADDPALVNHARLAFTTENPLYEPAVDGIWWERKGARGSGITMPGQMAMLAGAGNEGELRARLEQLRGLTDIDGSIWWWPYLYPANDPDHIRRRDWPTDCAKSGYVAAIYCCLFVNNIIGARVDVPARQVALRPFCPWRQFSWTGCRLGKASFDFEYRRDEMRIVGRITNRNLGSYTGTIELVAPAGTRVQGAILNGAAAPDSRSTMRYRRPAAQISRPLAPGEDAQFEINCSI
ncbi:MAG: hypothetical protein ABSC08_04305 [Bryobacteraceae bacterium]|jgi:hypothetical protein